MKTRNFILNISFFLLSGLTMIAVRGNNDKSATSDPKGDVLTITTNGYLQPLVENWIARFREVQPEAAISLATNQGVSGHSLMISMLNPAEKSDGFSMLLARDAVVVIVGKENRASDVLMKTGISIQQMKEMLKNTEGNNAKDVSLAGSGHMYMIDNPAVRSVISGLSGSQQEGNNLIGISESSIRNILATDPAAMIFCRLGNVLDEKGNFADYMQLVPVDKNGNGRLDGFEKIYRSPDQLLRGIWIGKYPAQLTQPVMVTGNTADFNKARSFVEWIMGSGQDQLLQMGFIPLSDPEVKANLAFFQPGIEISLAQQSAASYPLWLIVVVSLMIIALITGVIISLTGRKSINAPGNSIMLSASMSPGSMNMPSGIFFDKTHTWAFMEKDGAVKLGVDDFLQHLTGNISKIELIESGTKVRKGEKIMTVIRDGKQLNLYSPVTGTVKNINSKLINNASLINASPYGDGWVYEIEPLNWLRESQLLLIGEKSREWLNGEFQKLRDFLALSASMHTETYNQLVLQDGGEISDHVLSELGPETWEDFQEQFIDTAR